MSSEKPLGNGAAVKRVLAMGPPDAEFRADIERVRESMQWFEAPPPEDEASD